jgi:hypothetical protein
MMHDFILKLVLTFGKCGSSDLFIGEGLTSVVVTLIWFSCVSLILSPREANLSRASSNPYCPVPVSLGILLMLPAENIASGSACRLLELKICNVIRTCLSSVVSNTHVKKTKGRKIEWVKGHWQSWKKAKVQPQAREGTHVTLVKDAFPMHYSFICFKPYLLLLYPFV